MDLPGSDAPTHGSAFAWFAPVLVGALLVAWPALRARGAGALAVARVALVALAVVSCANYVDFGRYRYGTYLNEWDVYHYYLGTKYADEVGYFGLYEATLVADADGLRRYRNPEGRIRDLETIGYVPVESVLARAESVRARFSASRWRAFVRDVAFFARALPGPRFSELLCDRGYNGTPVFTALVRTFLSGWLPIDRAYGRFVLVGVDVVLLALTAWAIARAYGRRAALLVVCFVGTHYLLSWGHLKGALVRTDFACATAMAVCAMRTGRGALAGALLAYATCSRVFPALFLLGPIAVLFATYARARRWDAELVRCFVGYGATLAALLVFSAVVLGDLRPFAEFATKIVHHASDASTWNIGYRVLLDADFHDGVPIFVHMQSLLADDAELRFEHDLVRAVVAITVLFPALSFASELPRDRAMAFGFVFVFFLVPISYYYALILVPFLLFFLADARATSSNVGAAMLFASGSLGYLFFSGFAPLSALPVFRGHHQDFPTYYYSSAVLLAVVVLAIATAGAFAHGVTKQRSPD